MHMTVQIHMFVFLHAEVRAEYQASSAIALSLTTLKCDLY